MKSRSHSVCIPVASSSISFRKSLQTQRLLHVFAPYLENAVPEWPVPFPSDRRVTWLNVTLFVFLLFPAKDKLPIFLGALDAGRL